VQVHHDEGVANRIDPESCADIGHACSYRYFPLEAPVPSAAPRIRHLRPPVPVGNSILLATDIESGDAVALCQRSVA
jgi:hypothetical protein